MRFFGMTNVGMKRTVNQDCFLIKEYKDGLLAVVCDGMGGALGGSEASNIATAAFSGYTDIGFDPVGDVVVITEEYVRDVLMSGARAANNAVFAASKEEAELDGMGTTLVAAYISGGKAYAVNVGDSRMYLIKDETITQVTHDHSYVQYLVDIGKLTAAEAKSAVNKNIITRAVGTEENVESDFFAVDANMEGGHVLLCSDGLTNHISEETIAKLVSESVSPEEACEKLIESANLGGGSDNITVVVISM